ncbi:hypothetical protein OHA72_51850 [Dactylosporangium sp. NBC_01737]|uniref:hypothetical protein n=1 Tax=Dactylosporangium sp. NBC_01737 TaxID=2975959 RepID=UPI002E0D4026|nr:hypothetical protein OHA72_51850 [Dactylosporangium sp. NBC_01737]
MAPDASWDVDARRMFGWASPVPEGRYLDYLTERGWTFPRGGRLFFQVNHSSVLAEIAQMLLEP